MGIQTALNVGCPEIDPFLFQVSGLSREYFMEGTHEENIGFRDIPEFAGISGAIPRAFPRALPETAQITELDDNAPVERTSRQSLPS